MPESPAFPLRVPVRVVGHDLPGIRFAEYEPVYLGLKRGQDAEAVTRADADEVVFDLYVDIKPDRSGELDYRGPYIAGLGKDDRAIGLVWGVMTDDERFMLFRGAKLRLPPIEETLIGAMADGGALQASVSLTGDRGGPITARIPDAKLSWELRSAPAAAPETAPSRIAISRS
jgi:hypothetical protein